MARRKAAASVGPKERTKVEVKKVGRGIGRPVGTDRFALVDSNAPSYAGLKDVLKFLPNHVAERIRSATVDRKDAEQMNNRVLQLSMGIWSVFPMTCSGERCSYRGTCPLLISSDYTPLGEQCPLEMYMMHKYMGEYMRALNVVQTDKVEMDQIGTIVMCDMIIMRIRGYMARRPDGHIDESPVGVDDNGNIVLKRDISKEILIEEKYQKIKTGLLESLLATREIRAKYDVIDENDPSVRAAKLRMRAQELKSRKATEGEVDSKKLLAQAEFFEDVAKTLEVSQTMIDVAGAISTGEDNTEEDIGNVEV